MSIKDFDVFYFDNKISRNQDQILSRKLSHLLPARWDCNNQAKVHLFEPKDAYFLPHAPYSSLEDSMADWTFTANVIAIRLNKENQLETLAPFGVDDLLNLIIRLTPAAANDPRLGYINGKASGWLNQCKSLRFIK